MTGDSAMASSTTLRMSTPTGAAAKSSAGSVAFSTGLLFVVPHLLVSVHARVASLLLPSVSNGVQNHAS